MPYTQTRVGLPPIVMILVSLNLSMTGVVHHPAGSWFVIVRLACCCGQSIFSAASAKPADAVQNVAAINAGPNFLFNFLVPSAALKHAPGLHYSAKPARCRCCPVGDGGHSWGKLPIFTSRSCGIDPSAPDVAAPPPGATIPQSLKDEDKNITYKGMKGEPEKTDSEVTEPACGPSTRAMQVAQITVLGMLLTLTIAGCLAVVGLLPGVEGLVLSILYWFLALGAVVNTMQLLARAALPRDQRKPGCDDTAEWPWTVSVLRWLWRGLLVLALVYAHYGLAALLAYGLALGIASRAEKRLILGDERPFGGVSRTVHRFVYAVFEQLAPVCAPLHRLLMRPAGGVPLIGWILFVPLLPLVLLLAAGYLMYWLLKGLFAFFSCCSIGGKNGIDSANWSELRLVKANSPGSPIRSLIKSTISWARPVCFTVWETPS